MSDALRESTGDKLSRNLKPEGAKSTTEQVSDTARDAYESVAGTVQPNSQKGLGQSASDALSNNDKSTNAQGEGLVAQAMNAVGLDGNAPLLPQVQQAAANAANSVTGNSNVVSNDPTKKL